MQVNSPRRIWEFLGYLREKFVEDNCQTTAAALTYQTLFAIVPALTVAFVILNYFAATKELGEQFENYVFANIIPENAAVVQEYLTSFSRQARTLTLPSVVLLAGTAFLMLFTIERTFNDIWQVREPRHGAQRFLMYWAVLTLGAPFVAVSLVATTYISSLPFVSEVTEATSGLRLLPVLLGAGFLTLVYLVVPNCYVSLKHAFAGGVGISMMSEIAKALFTEIMSLSNLEAMYGTFAAVLLFLIWLYVSWTLVLLGAVFVKSLGIFRFEQEEDLEAPIVQVVLILELFYRAHQKGEVLRDQDIRQHTRRIHLELWPEVKARLLELGLIRSLERGGMILARDLNEVSVWDIQQQLGWRLPSEIKGDRGWERTLSKKLSDLHEQGATSLQVDLESMFKQDQA